MGKKKKVIVAMICTAGYIEITTKSGKLVGRSILMYGFEMWIFKRFGREKFLISNTYLPKSIKAELILSDATDPIFSYLRIKGTNKKNQVEICESGIEYYFGQKKIRTLYFKKLPANAKRNNRRNGDR